MLEIDIYTKIFSIIFFLNKVLINKNNMSYFFQPIIKNKFTYKVRTAK